MHVLYFRGDFIYNLKKEFPLKLSLIPAIDLVESEVGSTTLQKLIVDSEVRVYDSAKVNRRKRGTRVDICTVNRYERLPCRVARSRGSRTSSRPGGVDNFFPLN